MLLRDDTERQQLRRQLERTGSAAGAETLMAGGEAAAGTLRRTTILFSDVRGFTTLSEELGAAGVVALLNEYFSWMADVIRGEGGTIDKFIGDAIMALFGSPIARDDDPKRAVRAALAMLNALDMLNADRAAQGRSLLEIGIGLATGEVIAGQIGSPDRLNYTVIGDAVNLAARLEARTKDYGVPLLTCGVTAGELGLEVPRRLIDVVRVKGQSNPAEVHEILRLPASDADTRAWLRPFEAGMAAYRSGDFSAAIALLDTALIARPEDRPAALLRERCGLLLASRPGRWDGVWTLTEK
jgi:adenylate cyclase